jgi:replicative DNA helicase
LQAFTAQALAGDHVVYGCTESSAEEIMTRMTAQLAGVSMEEALEPTSALIVQRLQEAAAKLARVKDNFIVWGEDDFESDINRFCYLVMSAWRKWGALDMFYLDHFADIDLPDSDESADKFKGVKDAVRALKRVAIKTNSAGTVLTQFNKDAEDIKRPGLKHITGSAHFTRPMRIVSILLNIDYKPGEERKDSERVEWYSVKTRFAKGWLRHLTFRGREGRFYREASEYGDNGDYTHKYRKEDAA